MSWAVTWPFLENCGVADRGHCARGLGLGLGGGESALPHPQKKRRKRKKERERAFCCVSWCPVAAPAVCEELGSGLVPGPQGQKTREGLRDTPCRQKALHFLRGLCRSLFVSLSLSAFLFVFLFAFFLSKTLYVSRSPSPSFCERAAKGVVFPRRGFSVGCFDGLIDSMT